MHDDVETITGELAAHRVVGDDFYSIATIKTTAGAVAVVGKLLGAQLGDTLEVEGVYTTHPKFGRQFRARLSRVVVPRSDNGAESWIASRLPNVGAARARAMLDHFGGAVALWKVIESSPDRLVEVDGVTPDRASAIVDAYRKFRGERDRMIRFRSWGMTENQIAKMLAAWGDEAEDRLRANPYALAELVDGFGFLRADAIAQRMGLPSDAVPRIECGLRHTMEQATGHGHVFVATGKLVALAAEKVLRVPGDVVALHLAIMRKRGDFVQHGARTFTRRLDEVEARCADSIRALLARRKEPKP